MTEQEVKDTVEQIVKFEADEKHLMESEDFIESSACTEAVQMLEEELEEQGYFLGEDGTDMIVYHKVFQKKAGDEWLRYDRANGQWRQSNESN
jgi:hypothetical protein